jgi:hypothetical protein
MGIPIVSEKYILARLKAGKEVDHTPYLMVFLPAIPACQSRPAHERSERAHSFISLGMQVSTRQDACQQRKTRGKQGQGNEPACDAAKRSATELDACASKGQEASIGKHTEPLVTDASTSTRRHGATGERERGDGSGVDAGRRVEEPCVGDTVRDRTARNEGKTKKRGWEEAGPAHEGGEAGCESERDGERKERVGVIQGKMGSVAGKGRGGGRQASMRLVEYRKREVFMRHKREAFMRLVEYRKREARRLVLRPRSMRYQMWVG